MRHRFTRRALASSAATIALVACFATADAKVEGDTIVLGSAISLTGKYSGNGIHSKNGYDIAIQRVNEMGGVQVGDQSYKLAVTYYDDESTPARATQLAERLINQDGTEYMLGPYSSGLTAAIAPVTEQYQVPMVEAEGASRSLFNKGYEYLFAVLSTSEQYLRTAIALAAEQAEAEGKDPSELKVAMAFENDPFSLDVRDGVVEDIESFGMQIVVDDKLPRDLSDFSTTLTKVKALQPDILVLSGHDKGAATLARQYGEMGLDVPMVAVTHCEGSDIANTYKEAVNGFFCPTQWSETLSYSDEYFGTAEEFDQLFKETYTDYQVVPYQSAQAAAAVLVFKEAFERAGSFDKKAVRDAIAETKMETFYGNIEFAPEGNNIAKPMVLRQIQDGNYVVVAPTEWAANKPDLSFNGDS
ncbi:MAG: amino acid ABC transporter substrate-binding protein [Pseudomonadota bacterium]